MRTRHGGKPPIVPSEFADRAAFVAAEWRLQEQVPDPK